VMTSGPWGGSNGHGRRHRAPAGLVAAPPAGQEPLRSNPP